MAQNITFDNDLQQTVNFSSVGNGEIFIYNNEYCVKLNNNNPNYVIIGENKGSGGKLNDTDQVIHPGSVIFTIGSV